MTREEAIDIIKCLAWHARPDEERIEQAIKVLEQEPCEDTVSKKALDKALYERFHDEDAPNNMTDVRLGTVRNFVRDFPYVTATQRWIPVSERLPEECGEYICTMSNGGVQECGFVPSDMKELVAGWSTCEADGFKKLDYQDIIAWQPLPKPYEVEMEGVEK